MTGVLAVVGSVESGEIVQSEGAFQIGFQRVNPERILRVISRFP